MPAAEESPQGPQPTGDESDRTLVRPHVSHLRPPTTIDVPHVATAELPAIADPTPTGPETTGGHRRAGHRLNPLWIAIALVAVVATVLAGGWLVLRHTAGTATATDLGPALPAFPPPEGSSTGEPSLARSTGIRSATSTAAATRSGTRPALSATTMPAEPPAATKTATAVPTPVFVPPHTAAITSIPGTCVDNNSNWSVEGNPIQLWECNNTEAQRWSYGTDATLRVQNMCMRPAGATPASGTLVQLRACTTAYQGWLFRSNGTVFNPASGLCLTDPGVIIDGRRQLTVATCTGGASQRWTFG